jgi:hypothetical protein
MVRALHAKPIYLLLALALVLSLVIMAVPMAGTVQAAGWGPYTGPKEPAFPRSQGTTTTDPTGDTYGIGAVQHDITSFSAYYTATELMVTVEFAGTISPSDSGLPNAIFGYIDFDTDQNPATGMMSNVDAWSPYTTGLGVDYFVDLGGYSSATGDTPMLDDTWTEVGRAPVSFTSNSFTVTVPLSLIGGDDGIVDTATVLGTYYEPTDACPNGGYITSSPAGQVTIFSECFEGGLPGDWTVINNGGDCVWRDDDPQGWGPLDGCSGTFMIADSDWCGSGSYMDTALVTPSIDCSTYSTIILEFDHYFYYYTGGLNETADVDVWDGTMWHNKARYQDDTSGHVTIDISDVAAGKNNVKVRWHYYNASWEWYWEVDCVKLSGTYEPIVGVGGEAYPVNKPAILAPWIGVCAALIAGAGILLSRRRAQS